MIGVKSSIANLACFGQSVQAHANVCACTSPRMGNHPNVSLRCMHAASGASRIDWLPVRGTEKQSSESRTVGTPCRVGFVPGADGPCPRIQHDDQPHHEALTWIDTRAARNKLAFDVFAISDIRRK